MGLLAPADVSKILAFIGEAANATITEVLHPATASIDSHGNTTTADLVSVWTGSAACHLKDSAVIQMKGSADEERVTSVTETSLTLYLADAPLVAPLVQSGWEESATRIRISDERLSTSTSRVYRVISSSIHADHLVDSIRLSLWPSSDA